MINNNSDDSVIRIEEMKDITGSLRIKDNTQDTLKEEAISKDAPLDLEKIQLETKNLRGGQYE